MRLICKFVPGGLLIVLAGVLLDVNHGLGVAVGVLGFFLLIAWPIFSTAIQVRHSRRLKRGQDARDRLNTFVESVDHVILVIVLPAAMLGGLGVFCLVTAPGDNENQTFKIIVGVGSLGLLAAYLLMLFRGRSGLTLRMMGAAVAVFGIGGFLAVASVLADDGFTSVGDAVMMIASVVMTAAGLWLAVTGRNTLRHTD